MGRLFDQMLGRPAEMLERVEMTPLEGTRMSLSNSIIPNWWEQNITGSFALGDPTLAERVWVANRCQQLNAQQIASMPLVFHGGEEPAWVSSPDPNWYPNGIGDALHSIVDQLYGWGFSCQYITDFYATGFPRTWTVLPSSAVQIRLVDGAREYKLDETVLDPRRVVQIDRNPGTGVKGTSALRAYAQTAWGLLAAGNQSLNTSQGGIPQAVLKSERKLTAEQAAALQEQWMTATSGRNGAPPVLPPELDFQVLSINPSDLALLETQEWNARVLATAYGVPAVILNMSLQGGLTYQNPAALGEMWWRFELRTTATRIANAFTAQMLPRGQWVSFDAADTFADLTEMSDDDDAQLSQVAKASPAQQMAREAFELGMQGAPEFHLTPHITVHPGTTLFADGAFRVAAPNVTVEAAQAPNVTVEAAQAPNVTVEAAQVTVEAAKAPNVTVEAPPPAQVIVEAARAPHVTVEAPAVTVEAPLVTVEAARAPNVTVAAAAAPNVTVEAPPAPNVTVEAPVTVHAAPAPNVDIHIPSPKPRKVNFSDGRTALIEEAPVG